MLPRLVADVPLAPEGETLFDLRLDRTGNRLFVTDTGGQLHVLDATTYEPITVLPFGGWLELDAPNQRLYVYQPYLTQDQPPLIHVIDTTTLAEVGTLPGSALAVDSAHNRLFVGDRFAVTTAPDAPGVRIVDGATLAADGELYPDRRAHLQPAAGRAADPGLHRLHGRPCHPAGHRRLVPRTHGLWVPMGSSGATAAHGQTTGASIRR